MLHSDGALGLDRWKVIEVAAAAFGLFLGWIALFERRLEPLLRKVFGRLMGCTIVWLPVGRFRIWGPSEARDRTLEAAVAVCCCVVVLSSAALPVMALDLLSLTLKAEGEDVGAAVYLMATPLMAIFVFRVGRRRPRPS